MIRPVKTCDFNVTDLDDAETEKGLAKVIAEMGRCEIGLVKVDYISCGFGYGKTGSTIVSCPVSTPKVLLERGRIFIGV